jgi:hypothetical protein
MAGTDLYIKWSTANPNDDGTRPIAGCGQPNGPAVWANASIWLSPPGQPGTTLNQAGVNQQIQINVVVTNKGESTFTSPDQFGTFLTVQVWVCNFTVAVGPNGSRPSSNGATGLSSTLNGNLPGGGGQAQFAVLWTPNNTDMLNVVNGQGHLCIAANVVWEGTTPPPESVTMPPPGVISVCGDGVGNAGGHQGQRNIFIGATAMKMQMLKVDMDVFNFGRARQTFVFEVQEVLGAGAIGAAVKEALLAERWVALTGAKPGRPRVKRDRQGHPVEPIERARLRLGGRLVLRKGGKPIRIARTPLEGATLVGKGFEGKGTKVEIALPARRSRRLSLELPVLATDTPGTARVFDVRQLNQHGVVIGGNRIVTVKQA